MKAERTDRRFFLCGLFAAVFGLKVYLILRFGTDLPFMDQWAREGDMLIAPWREGTFHWSDLFVPHSEHRIVPTLALNLGLAVWSGQWDGRVECVVNAVIHSALIVLLTAYVFRTYSRGAAVAAGWLQVGFALTALDWENTLGGFQSQFYFMIGFSLAAIWGLLDPRGWQAPRWWGGLGCGALATISMGSGLLCFAPVAALLTLRLIRGRAAAGSSETPAAFRAGSRLVAVAALAVVLAALAAGWLVRSAAPWELPLHAKTAGDFFRYFLHCLAWPARGWSAAAALVWLPWGFFAVRRWGRYSLRQEILLGAGLWVLLQIAAVSFYRGADGGYPADRYADIFQVGLLFNLLAMWEEERVVPTRRLGPSFGVMALWALILLAGSALGAYDRWHNLLPSIVGRSRLYEQDVALYLRNGDVSRLNPPYQVPFPYVDWFKRMVDRPAIRDVLPVSVNRRRFESPLSAAVRRFCRAGVWLFGAGILILLGLTTLTWRRTE